MRPTPLVTQQGTGVNQRQVLAVPYCAFVAGLLGLALFLPGLGNGFAYDDVAVVAADERVHSLSRIGEIFTTGYWRDDSLSLYRPLTTLSFAIDWSLAPGSAAWFHLSNALLHAVVTALAVLLLAGFVPPAAALLGGLVFAVHPVHVEAVANVVGRAEMLAAVFSLGACILWIRESELPIWRTVRGVGVTMMFALALLSKESAVMLPALLLLLDFARGALRVREPSTYFRQNASELLALVVLLAAYLTLRGAVLGDWAPSRVDPTLELATTTRARLLTALQAWPVYLRLLVYPTTLLADYGPRVVMPTGGPSVPSILGVLILVGCVAGGIMAVVRGRSRTALALLWFPVAILPVSNLIVPIGVLVAERTLYLPSLALSFAVAGAAAPLLASHRAVIAASQAAGAALVLVLAARSVVRIPEWESTDRIMSALLRDRPDAFRAQWHNARAARVSGDTPRALESYAHALRLWPHREGLVLEAAMYAAEVGDLPFAFQVANYAARRWPTQLVAQRLLASTALDLADTTTARTAVRDGLRIDPHDDLLTRMAAVIPVLQEKPVP